MKKIELKINNISCSHCVNAIKSELLDIRGVKTAEGNPQNKIMAIEFEDPATEAEILKILQESNYPAE